MVEIVSKMGKVMVFGSVQERLWALSLHCVWHCLVQESLEDYMVAIVKL